LANRLPQKDDLFDFDKASFMAVEEGEEVEKTVTKLTLRQWENKEKKSACIWFLDRIVGGVVGKRDWPKTHSMGHLSDNVSPSDEACGLFLLHNNWECWIALTEAKRDGLDKRSVLEKPKHTKGTDHSTKKFGGMV